MSQKKIDNTQVDVTDVLGAGSVGDLSDVTIAGAAAGDILFYDGTNWVNLPRGTDGQVLTLGSPLLPTWETFIGGAGGSGSGDNVFAGDGITIVAGSPLSNKTISVDSTVLRTTSILDDLFDVTIAGAAAGDILFYDGAVWVNLPRGTDGQVLTLGSPLLPTWETPSGGGGSGTRTIGAAWVNEGTAITVPIANVSIHIPSNATIISATILGEGGPATGSPITGSCKVDVYKDILANFPPTLADEITGSPLPGITLGQTFTDSTLTGWTTSLTAGDVVAFHLQSTSTFTRITVQLELQE